MKIIAVIVTHNRLELLKKCVEATINQTRKPDSIIVINNGSTDNTNEWLSKQSVITCTQENKGGANGFSTGIRMAYKHDADWIWVMDDDTIPKNDALEQLILSLALLEPKLDDIGFLSSNVIWTDGTMHEMNKTYVLTDEQKLAKLSLPQNHELPFIQFGTFVSMLISAKAVAKVGLPIKEFFIWNDDIEYSKRMINNGLAGMYVKNSIAIHETPINNMSSVFKDTHKHLWKYRYGMRNELFTKRTHNGPLAFWITWVHRMFVMPFRILINRKDHRWDFIKLMWQTSLDALTFKPAIDHVQK